MAAILCSAVSRTASETPSPRPVNVRSICRCPFALAMVGPHPADLVFAPTPACGGGRRPRGDGLAPSPGPVARPGAGLTSKPRHARRPMVALRGSFRPRLASTTGEDPRATTDPVESPFEYSQAPSRERACGRQQRTTSWTPARASASAQAAAVAPVVRTSSTSDDAARDAAVRRTGSNAPRMAAAARRRVVAPAGRSADRRCSEPRDRQTQSAPTATRERPRLVVPALGQPLPRERHPRDRVAPTADRPRPWRRRARRPRPATPRTSAGGSPLRAGPSYRNGERARRRRAAAGSRGSDATGDAARGARTARTTAARAPRARPARRRRTATGPCRIPRTAAGTRRRAPDRARHDASGRHRHRTRAATAATYGRSSSIGAVRPRDLDRQRATASASPGTPSTRPVRSSSSNCGSRT